MEFLVFISQYETWLIWVVVLLALCLGRLLSKILKRRVDEGRSHPVKIRFKWIPIIGEIIIERKRVNRFVINRFVMFESIHVLLWILMYQKYGATLWILFGLPITSILLMMAFILRRRRRLPIPLTAMLGVFIFFMIAFDKGIPHISIRVTVMEHVVGIVIGLMLYPIIYIINNRQNDPLVVDLVFFSAIIGLMFGWILMFLAVTITIIIILLIEIRNKIRSKVHEVNHVDFGMVLISVVIILLFVGLDLVDFYLRLV
jgi:hypothetical protein